MNIYQKQLKEFLNECYQWKNDYVNNNDDFINGYAYVLEQTLDLDRARLHLDCDGLDDDALKELILDNYKIERASYHYPDNALTFINIDEIEDQVSGISNDKTNCVFTDITKHLTQAEIDSAAFNCDFTLNGDCIYFIPDFNSIQLVVDYEELQKEIDNLLESFE